MRRLLTGYAQQFNRRHKRHGHLFQNRYKSFLAKYDKSGHGVILGKYKYSWQDTEYVLRRFGKTVRAARRFYTAFVTKGIGQGRRPQMSIYHERPLIPNVDLTPIRLLYLGIGLQKQASKHLKLQ
jgi:hypothetical protein